MGHTVKLFLVGGGITLLLLLTYILLAPVVAISGGLTISVNQRVDLSPPVDSGLVQTVEPDSEPTPFRVAVAPVVSPERTLEPYLHFADYLGGHLGIPALMRQRRTYAEVNELLRHELCDLAFVCTYAFVRGEQDFGLVPLVIPRINGAVSYQAYIIVPAGSSATSLLDLRGLRFAYVDLMSNTGWLYPVAWLQEQGLDRQTFFGETRFTGSHDLSVEAVFQGRVDGASVHSIVYDRMAGEDEAVARGTRVIQKSPRYGMPPLVVPACMDAETRARLLVILTGMHEDRKGRGILAELGFDRFEVVDPSVYDSVRATVAEVETGLAP